MTYSTDKPRFRPRRLALLISLAALINACTTLNDQDNQFPDVEVDTTTTADRIQSGNRRANRSRSIQTSPEIQLSEAELAWQRSVWYPLSQGLSFYHEHYNEQIADEIHWFASNPDFLAQVSERAAPFIYEIVQEVSRRQLPMELALLPVIESAFQPKARSAANAAGLWQFMAPTASSLGLKRDWWYDGRHDPIASTSAALDYLEALYQQFNQDWLLALAAYNAGQGNVARAIARNEHNSNDTDFWSIPLPNETRRHVPRLLGLAYVMADPLTYNIALSDVPAEPYLASIDAGSQIDLVMAAELAGVEPEVIYQLNPGYLQWATPPDGPHLINLPITHAAAFNEQLANLGDMRITWDRYVIQPGDTLGGIASRYRTNVAALQDINRLNGTRIRAGDTLLIPRAYQGQDRLNAPDMVLSAVNSEPVPAGIYTVRTGDSLWAIANRYRLTVNELLEWNELDQRTVLRPGQRLVLQAPQMTASVSMETDTDTPRPLVYEVKRGDSLARIAREHNISVDDITEWNNIRRNSVIHPGQELTLYID